MASVTVFPLPLPIPISASLPGSIFVSVLSSIFIATSTPPVPTMAAFTIMIAVVASTAVSSSLPSFRTILTS
uniref:Uncharacterized protein n=2 Tax=Gibberella zeae TaxID=5518 RepID=A0A098DZP4_GIBZE